MNVSNKYYFLKWSIVCRELLIIIILVINVINAHPKQSLNFDNEEKRVFDGSFGNHKTYAIDDCIPLAFGDFNADKIVDIFCRNTQGDTIRVMLNDDRSPTSKEQCQVNITYVKI
jgi:hypothetical protein